MLPLLQMHPHAVPPPSNFDAFSAVPYREYPYDHDYDGAQPQYQPQLPHHHNHQNHHHQQPPQQHIQQSLQQHLQQHHQRQQEQQQQLIGDGSLAPYQQSFPIPIRTSQPHHRPVASSAPSFSARQEHHLRRKTPSGTIDAGYDGSPSQMSIGPPPLKHMILPASASASQYLSNNPQPHPLRQVVTAQHVNSPGYGLEARDQPNMPTPPWALNGDLSSYFVPQQAQFVANGMQPGQPGSYHGPNQFPNVYEPLMRASEYNVRAFCPPPPPMNESLPFGHIGWQPASSPWDYRSRGQFPAHPSHYFQPDPRPLSHNSLQHDQGVQSPYGGPTVVDSSYNPAMPSHSDVHILSLGPNPNIGAFAGGGAQGFVGQPHFKEKAMSQAHKSYVELLAHLQNSRKMNHMKTGPGRDVSARLLVYPKPPKPGSFYPSRENDNARFNPSACSEAFPVGPRRVKPFMSSNRPSLDGSAASFVGQPCYSTPGDEYAGDARFRDAQFRKHVSPYLPDHFSPPAPVGKASPVSDAKSSLEVIKSLCEQSGWKWIDGMLLGGCLLYGLEQYESALKWFSRITTLDSSHVEAITNMAATLYCLDRQDEAEQQWLKAVKLRPSYLEAAEHLVGLLYKNRSNEAVEVICHVQQALRLCKPRSKHEVASAPNRSSAPTTSHHHGVSKGSRPQTADFGPQISDNAGPSHDVDAESPGFGSSGYALPGRENGRILALVHAKGTMLYSLKEVEKASAAFEEAVLISVGRRMNGVQDLIRHILAVLSSPGAPSGGQGDDANSMQPLLLPPERARHTAQLVFAGRGELPGLAFLQEGPPRRAAVQTTSNSLLSLAKIFQDSMSSGSADPSPGKRPSGVGDILALYYLSLSLQESPSTANNVGILLAGVQQAVTNSVPSPSAKASSQPSIPGIPPGSGLALALAYYNYGLRLDPKHVHLHTNLGSLLKDIGQLDLAIQMYERAVSCDGSFDIALTNLANAVKDRGRVNDAITYYRRAVEANPNFAEAVCGLFTALNSVCDWSGRGGAMLEAGRFDRWHVDDEGMLQDVRTFGRGRGLTKRVVEIVGQQLEDASHWGRNMFQESIISALTQQLQYLCGDRKFDIGKALRQWANKAWEGSRVLRLVERATRVVLWRWYNDKYVTGKTSKSRYLRPRLPSSLTVPSAPTVLPFHTFTCPLSAKDIRMISQRNAMRISCSTLRSPWLPTTVYPPPPPPNPHLNIGYVSSDFNNHPLAHLMQSVFGFHDPARAKAFCYATTTSDGSSHRQQIEREAPVFRDVSSWTPDKLIDQIVKDEIHILVNLNGYTRGARNDIFAARPAPIQMSFMGFAGTMGAEWCDYILADTTAIPPSTLRPCRDNIGVEDVFRDTKDDEEPGWMYSENIVFCRDTFFCCDHAQSCEAEERDVTWEQEERRRWKMRKELFPNMPDDAIILGNFNQLYKIDPTTFRSWLRILARVPKAVLWLLRFPELGESNLRKTAEAWAGAEVASRLIFTDVAPKSQHISRARVCDLFLDTPECNAHTTAADVLWSSTPLLTLPRYSYKMCSRMAASILRGALPKSTEGEAAAGELIAGGEAEYEQTAVRLAAGLSYSMAGGGNTKGKDDASSTNNSGTNGSSAKGSPAGAAAAAYGQGHGRLAEMRKLLWESKWHCGLFNTRRWVDDVERAYEEAWKRWVAGEGGDIYL